MSRIRKAPAPAAILRPLRLGDLWVYQVSGTLTPPGPGAPSALRGTITVTVVPDTLLGAADSVMLTFVQDLQAQDSDGAVSPFPAPAMMFSFAQDKLTNDALILADNMGPNGTCRRAETPQIFYPGRWFLGTRYDNRLEFGDGDFVRNTLLVVGQVPIETPVGMINSWVAEISSESPAMGKITGIDWWSPDLGAPACFETNATMPDGTVTCLKAMLKHTNVLRDHGPM